MQFYESGVKCPSVKEEFTAVLVPICENYNHVQDSLNGFITNYIHENEDELIPIDVVNLISVFLTKEYVYLLQKGRMIPKLWKICVDDILNACK